jgi:hypothetical protein
MNKLYVLLIFITLAAYVACQRQRTEERKNPGIDREMQERVAAEHPAREQQQVTQDEDKLNARETAPEMTLTPASSASPSTSPEKRYDLKSQAQKFQPRRIVPMTSPIRETTPSTPESSEAPADKLNKNETEKQKSDRKEAVQSGEGLSPLPAPGREPSPVQAKVPQGILEPILDKAAELAEVAREQLVMVRAEPAVWNDGSLGCPEPGMQYTQALVNGYWVIIEADGKKYDFRVGSGGSFRLCPPGQGQLPSQSAAN